MAVAKYGILQDEMLKLAMGLTNRGIKFWSQSLHGGLQIICEDEENDWDAICHEGSYGHEDGLIEVMGLPQCDGDVIGYLTANKILLMVDNPTKAYEDLFNE